MIIAKEVNKEHGVGGKFRLLMEIDLRWLVVVAMAMMMTMLMLMSMHDFDKNL